MKNFFKYALILAVILVVGGSAWANTYTDHVKIAPNGQGDLLIFPYYLATTDGWETKLTVTNTSLTTCVVAKVSVRDAKLSQDLRDFLIYLSPADVWTGTLKYSAKLSKIVIYSDDDSVRNTDNTAWATPAVPFEYDLVSSVQYVDNTIGYVHVIEASAIALPPNAPGVSKDNIYTSYSNSFRPGTINTLSGKMEVKYLPAGMSTSLGVTTLEDYRNTEWLQGSVTDYLGTKSRNLVTEVEAALAKTYVAMPYVKKAGAESALHLFTFPTKQSYWNGTTFNSPFFVKYGVSISCNPDAIEYYADIFDLKENRKYLTQPVVSPQAPYVPTYLCYELNILSTLQTEKNAKNQTVDVFPWAEGWSNYGFMNFAGWLGPNIPGFVQYTTTGLNVSQQPLTYTGAPVIATYLYFDAAMGNLQAGYPSWVDGAVSDNASRLITDYQYSNLPY